MISFRDSRSQKSGQGEPMSDRSTFDLIPIGLIHSPYKTRAEAPYQGRRSDQVCELELFGEYEEGLKDIEGFSHLVVLYYLHEAETYSLSVRTPWDSVPHGVFSTRSPNRPNPLGLSVVKLVA